MKLIIYKYLLFIFAGVIIKTVKEYERIRLEIVYLFVRCMLSVGVTVVADEERK